MITKEQAEALRYGQELHYGHCHKVIGPRGGETLKQIRVRVSGMPKTWKTRPSDFQVPVKYGLYESAYLTHNNASEYHLVANCPLGGR